MQDENWDDLRIILAVARAQSFAKAAHNLAINESTVARRIIRAEKKLNAQLFERIYGKLVPTKAGDEIAKKAEIIELEVQSAHSKVYGTDSMVAGSVRVTSVPIITNRILAPALPKLMKTYPTLKIELIADSRDLSLTKREADIALRLARPNSENRAIARKVGKLNYAVYGTIDDHTEPLRWINYEDTMSDLPHSKWITEKYKTNPATAPQVQVNDGETILHCIKAGVGKSLLPVLIAEKEQGLKRLEDYPETLSRELWLMIHPEMRELARIRVVMDWLISIFNVKNS